jgi:hypothetical protein
MDDPDLKLLLGIIAVIVLGLIGWTFRDALLPGDEPVPAAEPPVPAEAEATIDTGPRYPLPGSPASRLPQDAGQSPNLVPLPPLDDSDAYFLLEIGNNFHGAFEALLVRGAVIDRLVSTVDNLTRPKIADNIRPVERLPQAFGSDIDLEGNVVLGPSSYLRYDPIVAQIYYVDLDAAYDMYQRFYPLFQRAYERLGYPDAYFNDRLVEVIDHLLAAPVPAHPIVLVRPNVLYEFADPDLEALSSGQKLMLRMGPDNAATMKRVLEKFRTRLTGGSPE